MSGDTEASTTVPGASAFSSDDQAVLQRSVQDSSHCRLTIGNDQDLENVFEIQRCTKWIKDQNLKAVTLQFPDSLLEFAPQVASKLQKAIGER